VDSESVGKEVNNKRKTPARAAKEKEKDPKSAQKKPLPPKASKKAKALHFTPPVSKEPAEVDTSALEEATDGHDNECSV